MNTMTLKFIAIIILPIFLSSCAYLSAQEESNLALAKWQGKKSNDFFFEYGKGEFQAKNSQGNSAYIWSSPARKVQDFGKTYIVKVPDPIIPNLFTEKYIKEAGQVRILQCKLRIETASNNKIVKITNINNSAECGRYFSLPNAERQAIIDARK